MTATLNPPPIRLKPRKLLIPPTPDPLPILTMGAATQKLDAPESVTPSISQKVAETQEPVTHSVAETQEPAMAETQETSTAETQEPVADSEIELQELEIQTSFDFEITETQMATHPAAETQEPATGITVESKEIKIPEAATQHPVAETQESAANAERKEIETPETATQHPVAETQELATNSGSKETETLAAATQHSEAETQQPDTAIDIEIQELEVEGAETLLSLHQEAETQASEAIPAAAPQEPAKETMTATQEPVILKSKQTMADVLQENEFLKSQLEQHQQELIRAREAYDKELTRYALERTTIMAERSTESICKEYMCCQCGNLYYQAGYKIVQVPVPGTVPTPSPFEVKPAVTQEPAGLRKSETEPVVTQEPAGPSKIKKEAPPVVNKAVQTVPIKEITSPSQVTPPTYREQSTQTLPGPTTTNAQTQTSHRWDEYEEIQRWKKEYAKKQAQQLQVHRQNWRNHTFLVWEALDLTRQEIRKVKKDNRQLKDKMIKVFDMIQKLMTTRKPSCNYSLFFMERLMWFQLRSIIEGKPYEVISSIDFIQTFEAASTKDQHFLCEAYLHNEAILENRTLNMNPLVGDVQLRAFTSFLLNQITWQNDFTTVSNNEDKRSIWIRPEPQRAGIFIAQYRTFLRKKGMTELVQQLQSAVIQDCERIISAIQIPALQANNLCW
jgi:chemotaxis protein histidine kinase CheA